MLSENAMNIKRDLEQIKQFNLQISKLETKKANLLEFGFPQGSKMFIDGGALNKTEEMYVCIIAECEKIDKKIAELHVRNFEIERKLVELHSLNSTHFNMVYDRYLCKVPLNLVQLARIYGYETDTYVVRIFNKIFELLVVL